MITVPMRLKEEAEDYGTYPTLIYHLCLQRRESGDYKGREPEPAHIKTERFVNQYGIKKDHAQVLTSELELQMLLKKWSKILIRSSQLCG
jgi:aspartyl-tRNA(Asn)/glutamyl-tRNA(Gln) amidotransferase subunit B